MPTTEVSRTHPKLSRRRPSNSAAPPLDRRTAARDRARAQYSTRPTTLATSAPSGPTTGAPHRSRPLSLALQRRSACAVQPVPHRHEQNGVCIPPCSAHGSSACSSELLQGKQKSCPACTSLPAIYRERTVPACTYDIALTRHAGVRVGFWCAEGSARRGPRGPCGADPGRTCRTGRVESGRSQAGPGATGPSWIWPPGLTRGQIVSEAVTPSARSMRAARVPPLAGECQWQILRVAAAATCQWVTWSMKILLTPRERGRLPRPPSPDPEHPLRQGSRCALGH